ncbi:hypothetical protein [Providencia phage PSTCR5]|uniref:Calcineurin-like phosphoesterase domain-containing protein n=1 Tax=Providencia phage PSTCR5 TaxID=2783547 RepID=A0A873WL89_9CAUD|nr:NinI-like serine-threonine phosphatase [Providencia phage PSTCR5]QPB12191.1 hypothetical protein [Providencia phage PSTCR5]
MILDNFESIKMHMTLRVPDESELFVIGDIHGKLDDLYEVLDSVGFRFGTDYLVCCGDLIDRGHQNLEVVDAFNEETNWFTVLGNHDLFPITSAYNLWVMNGGSWAMEQNIIYQEGGRYKTDHDFFMKMIKHPVVMTVLHRGKKFGIVHAGIPVHGGVGTFIDNDWNFVEKALHTFGTQALEAFVWDRDLVTDVIHGRIFDPVKNIDMVFHGHTVIDNPLVSGNRVYLDLGGVFYGTYAVALPSLNELLVVKLDKDTHCHEVSQTILE